MSGLPVRVVLVTPNFDNNSLGRTYCLWMMARDLGIEVRICGVKGRQLWAPLASGEFSQDCILPVAGTDAEQVVLDEIRRADLVIAIKPLQWSLGVALRLTAKTGTPLMVDIDDPDVEVRTSWRPLTERARAAFTRADRRRSRELRALGAASRRLPRTVSNPVLQKMYGGLIIPHVRRVPITEPVYSERTGPIVRFVGTPRGHKGVAELREAVAGLQAEAYTLEVTGPEPEDPRGWERWLGETSLEEGARLVAGADVIVIPSLKNSWSPAQLPAKLIDAMMNGRAIVASRTAPIEWALGEEAGLLVEPGNVGQLKAALARFASPDARREFGLRARERALDLFAVERVTPAFRVALEHAMERRV